MGRIGAAVSQVHHDALLFLEPAVLAEVVPAYLATALRRDPELDMLPSFLIGVLTRSEDDDNDPPVSA